MTCWDHRNCEKFAEAKAPECEKQDQVLGCSSTKHECECMSVQEREAFHDQALEMQQLEELREVELAMRKSLPPELEENYGEEIALQVVHTFHINDKNTDWFLTLKELLHDEEDTTDTEDHKLGLLKEMQEMDTNKDGQVSPLELAKMLHDAQPREKNDL